MLSIVECRKLIQNGDEFTDKEIMEIRDTLYEIADIAFEKWMHEKNQKV